MKELEDFQIEEIYENIHYHINKRTPTTQKEITAIKDSIFRYGTVRDLRILLVGETIERINKTDRD